MKIHLLALLALAGAVAPAANALADRVIVYQSSFETQTPDAHFANYHLDWSDWVHFTDFNGRFTNSWTQFSMPMPVLPPGITPRAGGSAGGDGGGGGGGGGGGQYAQFYVTFDLYTIDAWYGTGADNRMIVTANTTDQLLSDTFATMPGYSQTFRAPDVGPAAIGFGAQPDALYRNIDLPFSVASQDTIRLRWNDSGNLQGGSWGLDNVIVSYEIVPAPTSGVAMGALALLGARRRRR